MIKAYSFHLLCQCLLLLLPGKYKTVQRRIGLEWPIQLLIHPKLDLAGPIQN